LWINKGFYAKISIVIKNFIQKIENINVSFWQSAILFYIALFFRNLLESYSSLHGQNRILGITDIFFQHPLWFIEIFLSIFIVIHFLTKEKIEKISRLGVVVSFFLIIVPIFDLLLNNGGGVSYSFLSGSFSDLIKSFFSFIGNIKDISGASMGQKIEIITQGLNVTLNGYTATIFNIYRDRRYNHKSLQVSVSDDPDSDGYIAGYSADGSNVNYTSSTVFAFEKL